VIQDAGRLRARESGVALGLPPQSKTRSELRRLLVPRRDFNFKVAKLSMNYPSERGQLCPREFSAGETCGQGCPRSGGLWPAAHPFSEVEALHEPGHLLSLSCSSIPNGGEGGRRPGEKGFCRSGGQSANLFREILPVKQIATGLKVRSSTNRTAAAGLRHSRAPVQGWKARTWDGRNFFPLDGKGGGRSEDGFSICVRRLFMRTTLNAGTELLPVRNQWQSKTRPGEFSGRIEAG
jgi:hypothetical protein